MVLASTISSAAAAVGSTSSSVSLASAASNPLLVGGGWMFSTIIFSTYYTNVFLKYDGTKEQDRQGDFSERQMETIRKNTSPVEVGTKEGKNPFVGILGTISRPQLLTLYRFSGSLLLGIFANPKILDWWTRIERTIKYSGEFALPALFLFMANYCNSIALDRIGISLTYTSKCIIPLITVVLTLLIDGLEAMPSIPALLTLIPIAVGVGMASWNSPTFDKQGFLAAIISSTAQASLNVSSKRSLMKTGINGVEAQRSMASIALIVTIAMSTFRYITSNKSIIESRNTDSGKSGKSTVVGANKKLPPMSLSLAAVAAYHFEYVLSFLFLRLVKPISYGTCDAVRRLGIIIAGRKMFGGEPFSLLNFSGIGMAILGALGYSIASSVAK